MNQTRLIALPLLVAMPLLLGSLTRSDVVSGDARLAASIVQHDPAVATGSLDKTLSVLAVFSSDAVGEAIAASRRMIRASPAGRRKTTLFVGLSTPISPRAHARVIALGGTIVKVGRPGDAANAELARDGSPLRIPSSDFAVLDDLSFSALWGRPIPNERGPQRLFHGRRGTVRAMFLHGREYAVADRALGWQRLVIPLSTGKAEFVWNVDGAGGNIPSILGRPVADSAYQIYDVVIPRLH
nr:hypothetical protein [Candidatus Eremiobacteraeota bacterium]